MEMRECPNQAPAGDIPQVHAPANPTYGQAAAIRGKADGDSGRWPVGEGDEGAAAGQLPEIAPLPTAEVFLAELRSVPLKQPARSAEIVQLQRLLGEIHVRSVEQATGLLPLGLGNFLCRL